MENNELRKLRQDLEEILEQAPPPPGHAKGYLRWRDPPRKSLETPTQNSANNIPKTKETLELTCDSVLKFQVGNGIRPGQPNHKDLMVHVGEFGDSAGWRNQEGRLHSNWQTRLPLDATLKIEFKDFIPEPGKQYRITIEEVSSNPENS